MLEISDLNKSYPGPVVALQDINLRIGQGMFGLLGPNGAGKSTLMRTLATLQLPDSGSVRLSNIDVLSEPRQARVRIGYLPQDMGVYPRVTAREMLEYLCALKGVGNRRQRKQEVQHQLDRVHLADVADRRLDTFSGGMKQRFGIAAAFLGRPKLVIVDEPTAGLDPTERRWFQLMLTESAKECVLILSSHIVQDISGLCDQMAILDSGRIILAGAPDEMVRKLDGRVWECTTELNKLDDCRSVYQVLSWRPHQGELNLRVWSEQPPVVQDSIPIRQPFSPVAPDLEDLYALHVKPGA